MNIFKLLIVLVKAMTMSSAALAVENLALRLSPDPSRASAYACGARSEDLEPYKTLGLSRMESSEGQGTTRIERPPVLCAPPRLAEVHARHHDDVGLLEERVVEGSVAEVAVRRGHQDSRKSSTTLEIHDVFAGFSR